MLLDSLPIDVLPLANLATISFIVDGQDDEPTTGISDDIVIDFPCIIEEWIILADVQGNATFDILESLYPGMPPTQSITGSLPPTMTDQIDARSKILTGWDKDIDRGTILRFVLTDSNVVKKVRLFLRIRKV